MLLSSLENLSNTKVCVGAGANLILCRACQQRKYQNFFIKLPSLSKSCKMIELALIELESKF